MSAIRKPSGDKAMAELAEAIGPDAACTVARLLGGTTVQAPREVGADHYLSRRLGHALAKELCHWLNGSRFYVPKQWERHKRAFDLHQAGALTTQQIALEVGMSERQVYRIIKTGERASLPERDDRQGDLFA